MAEIVKVGQRTHYIYTGSMMDVYVGLYELSDTEVCLIDTGDGAKTAAEIQEILERHNWNLKFIINTHSHIDHLGGNPFLMERWNCPAYLTKIARVFAENETLEAAYMCGGYPCRELNRIFDHPGPIGFEDLETFNLPEGLEYISLPGHAFGMVGVKTSDGVWFLGDSVLSTESLKKYQFGALIDVEEYLNTLDRLEMLTGRLFIPAHGDVVEDIEPLVHGNRENVLHIIDVILKSCGEGKTFDSLLKAIFDYYRISANTVQYMVIGTTLRCYLSYLKDHGRLECEFEENLMMWKQLS